MLTLRSASLGSRTAPGGGSACVGAWESFDSRYVNTSAIDLLRFIEGEGKIGVIYPPLNLTAWKTNSTSTDLGYTSQVAKSGAQGVKTEVFGTGYIILALLYIIVFSKNIG